jgi:hypothetical protein
MKLFKTLLILIQLTHLVFTIANTNSENQSFLERGLTIRTASLKGGEDELLVNDLFIRAFVQFILNRMYQPKMIPVAKKPLPQEKQIKQILDIEHQKKKDEFDLALFEYDTGLPLLYFVRKVLKKLKQLIYYGEDYTGIKGVRRETLIVASIYINRFRTISVLTHTNIYR